MDNRIALFPGTVLDFPGMPCEIESEVGRGSNSIAYKGRYPDITNNNEWHQVIIKELFPYHPQCHVFRSDNGFICCEEDSKAFFQYHEKSFANGNRVHLRMIRTFPAEMGANINTFHFHGTFYSVLGFTGGRSLLTEQTGKTISLRQIAVRFLQLLNALSCFHEEGYLHLDIAPDNIILYGSKSEERIMLIDFNSVFSLRPEDNDMQTISMKAGYSSPEIRRGDLASVTRASDLYSVTAIFYQCLTGKLLTPFQMSRPQPPDVSETRLLSDQPDTVRSMVAHILKRGLAVLPRRRYQTAEEMRQDFSELIDRIDGIGITHWSLWEAGRKSIVRYIQDNPAFSYLNQDANLFSVSVKRQSGLVGPVEACLAALRREDGNHLLLTGEGGSGKTTALLRFILTSQATYSPTQSAVLYLSLYSRKYAKAQLLHMILELLHFKTEHNTLEEARRILLNLLNTPIETASQKAPSLILLIDGLNEYTGSKSDDRDALFSEIQNLARLKGLRLLVSSRTAEKQIPAEHVTLLGLADTEIRRVLDQKGLALPESPDMQNLLKNPLMLSIFLKSAEASGKQIFLSGRDELLETYFQTMLDKEIHSLPEDSDERWMVDSAARFVLPAIAEEIIRKGYPLSDAELLPLMRSLYDLTKKKSFLKFYPSWTGRTSAIRGGAKNAEEWYGLIVHRILWKRLALLVRTDKDTYRLPHEIICSYLAAVSKTKAGKLRRRLARQRALVLLLVLILLAGLTQYVWLSSVKSPAKVYDQELESMVLVYGDTAFDYASDRAEALSILVDASYSTENYEQALSEYEETGKNISASVIALRPIDDATDDTVLSRSVARLLETGDVFSTSNKPLDQENFAKLAHLERELANDYLPLVETLSILVRDERLDAAFGEKYRTLLSELTDADADYAGILYYLTIAPNIQNHIENEKSTFTVSSCSPYQKKHNPETLDHDDLIIQLYETEAARGSGREGLRTKIKAITEAIQDRRSRYLDS